MNNKISKYIFIVCFLLITKNIAAQKSNYQGVYSEANTSSVSLNLMENLTFMLSRSLRDDGLQSDILLQGSMTYKDGYLNCINIKDQKTYKLKIINEEKILNINMPYIYQDTLYIIRKRLPNKTNARYFGSWKNRNKNGYWLFIPNGADRYYKLYKDGKFIESGISKDNN